jgi:hypothetical protein
MSDSRRYRSILPIGKATSVANINRGWNPTTNPLVINGYIIDGPRPGRKPKVTREFKQQILKKVTSDQYRREKSCAYIAAECGYSIAISIKAVIVAHPLITARTPPQLLLAHPLKQA